MSNDIKIQIINLENEMNSIIQNIKYEYLFKINELKKMQKNKEKQEFLNEVNMLEKIDIKNEFNDWWQLYLKVYGNIYKNNYGKYYFICDENDTHKLLEIKIINNYIGNINEIKYFKNITHNNKVIYCYVNIITNIKYIYINNNWEVYNLCI